MLQESKDEFFKHPGGIFLKIFLVSHCEMEFLVKVLMENFGYCCFNVEFFNTHTVKSC